jgi:hypothetical protein
VTKPLSTRDEPCQYNLPHVLTLGNTLSLTPFASAPPFIASFLNASSLDNMLSLALPYRAGSLNRLVLMHPQLRSPSWRALMISFFFIGYTSPFILSFPSRSLVASMILLSSYSFPSSIPMWLLRLPLHSASPVELGGNSVTLGAPKGNPGLHAKKPRWIPACAAMTLLFGANLPHVNPRGGCCISLLQIYFF